MTDTQSLFNYLLINTIGLSVLTETIYMAGCFASSGNGQISRSIRKEARDCFFFVEGTGLKRIIDKFGLLYDPDDLKLEFNNYFSLRQFI